MRVELDEKARGLPSTIENYLAYQPRELPVCSERPIEPEIKLLIPKTYDVFNVYRDIYRLHKTTSGIALADNRVLAREPLISYVLDTPDFDIMRRTGEQLRVRGPINVCNFDHEDPTEIIWRGQCTVKTLASSLKDTFADRVEIEAAIPSRDIRFAVQHFLQEDAPSLHQVYYDLNPDDLRVAAICVTARASFNSVFYVPEYDAYVEFENTCDPNYFFNPIGDVSTGKDMEFEAELKKLYVRPELGLTDVNLLDIYELAKKAYIDLMLRKFPGFQLSKYSKAERAMIKTGEFYHANRQGDGPTSAFEETSQVIAELPYGAQISAGMRHAIKTDVTIWDALNNIGLIAERVKKMAQPSQILPANNAPCAADKREHVRLRA
jgi:hypothetical protein